MMKSALGLLFSILVAWKLHVIFRTKDPIAPEDLVDLFAIDKSRFNTNQTFRNVDRDCNIILAPDVPSSPVYIGFLVHSAPTHLEQRNRYRQMNWSPGNLDKSQGNIKFIFVLGTVQDPKLQAQLESEHTEHGDILQTDISDGYRFLTYKSIAGFLWMHQNYNAKYLGKLDDDLEIDFAALVDILQEIEGESPHPNTVYCTAPYANFKPERRKDIFTGKFYMSEEEYEYSRYPPYCNGWIYIVESSMAWRLSAVASQTKFNYLEDVYVPGLLRERIEGARINLIAKGNIYRWLMMLVLSQCNFVCWYHYVLNQEVVVQRGTDTTRHFLCPLLLNLNIDTQYCSRK